MPTPPALIETMVADTVINGVPALGCGDLSGPFFGLASLLSMSPTFQAMVGVSGSSAGAEAMAFIQFPLMNIEAYGYPLPGAIITDDDSLRQFRERLGKRGGSLLVCLYDNVAEDYRGNMAAAPPVPIDFMNDAMAMRNRFGAIMAEMLALSGNVWRMTQWHKGETASHLEDPEYTDQDSGAFRCFRYASFIVDWV